MQWRVHWRGGQNGGLPSRDCLPVRFSAKNPGNSLRAASLRHFVCSVPAIFSRERPSHRCPGQVTLEASFSRGLISLLFSLKSLSRLQSEDRRLSVVKRGTCRLSVGSGLVSRVLSPRLPGVITPWAMDARRQGCRVPPDESPVLRYHCEADAGSGIRPPPLAAWQIQPFVIEKLTAREALVVEAA